MKSLTLEETVQFDNHRIDVNTLFKASNLSGLKIQKHPQKGWHRLEISPPSTLVDISPFQKWLIENTSGRVAIKYFWSSNKLVVYLEKVNDALKMKLIDQATMFGAQQWEW